MAYLHKINLYDIENTGTKGASVSLWFNHCPHRCVGCWNPETWDRDEALEIDNDEVVRQVIKGLDAPMKLHTLALLGGDPMSPLNLEDTLYILEKIKEKYPDLEVVCWTGYRWEAIVNNKFFNRILKYLDILIDGRFIESKKVEGFKWGSSNQRPIDVKKSVKTYKICLKEGM